MPRQKHAKSPRAATLADVGRAAGVSAMAASAVLNRAQTSSRIAPATRERILLAAARLHYRPNAAARALANRRMHTLGVATVFSSRELNHYFLEILHGILETAASHDQNVTVFTLHDWGGDTARLPALCDGRIDGLILLAPKIKAGGAERLPTHTPFVSLHSNTPLPHVLNIETDEERGAFDMIEYLIRQGHRRIMHLAGPPELLGSERRLRGYRRALAKARIAFDADLVVEAGFHIASGKNALAGWLERHAGEALPQAIFCANDSVATGCIEVLATAGFRVPEDVSVAGFDDTLLAVTAVPKLTTVHQPLREMGSRAVKELLALIDRSQGRGRAAPASPKPIVCPVSMVHRSSTGIPPAAPVIAARIPR
jgi:LacI family transcriptional regulator